MSSWMTRIFGGGACSPLQVYWLLETGHVTCRLLYSFVRGQSSINPAASNSPTEHKTLGWFEFRRQPVKSNILAAIWSVYVLWTVGGAYLFDSAPTDRFQWILDTTVGSTRHVTNDVLSTCLALTLLTAHTSRRLYQTVYVSIFSRHRIAGPLRLITAILFPIAAGLSVIANSPVLQKQSIGWDSLTSSLRWYHVPAVLLFVFASRIQSDVLKQLAKMRRNKAGHIVTTGYKLPMAGWFEKLNVSSPHFLAETLVYVSIGLALGGPAHASTCWLMIGYVLANHAHMAHDKQLFYRAKFEDLPKQRRSLLPLIF